MKMIFLIYNRQKLCIYCLKLVWISKCKYCRKKKQLNNCYFKNKKLENKINKTQIIYILNNLEHAIWTEFYLFIKLVSLFDNEFKLKIMGFCKKNFHLLSKKYWTSQVGF